MKTDETFTAAFEVQTKGDTDILDITPQVQKAVEESGMRDGLAAVSVIGSTASIVTLEYEPGLVQDLKALLEKIIPKKPGKGTYSHNHGWESNAHSHLRSALLGTSRTFPVSEGRLALGTWQQIVLADFDNRPRKRRVLVTLLGR